MRLPWRMMPVAGIEILTSLTENETARLVELAADATVLEIGSAYGYSTIKMAQAAKSVIAIDPHAGELANSLEVMNENLEAAGVWQKVMIVASLSQDVLPDMIESGSAGLDLVFVDGDHSRDACLKDLENGWKLLVPGGTLAAHDYGEATCPGVAQAIERFVLNTRCERQALTDTLWEARKP